MSNAKYTNYEYYPSGIEQVVHEGRPYNKSRVYFFMASPPITGGDLVYIKHIRALRQAGVDARVLYLPNQEIGRIFLDFPEDIPLNLLDSKVVVSPGDIVVVGESQGPFYRDLAHWLVPGTFNEHVKIVMFNQAVHWTANSFKNAQEFNGKELAGLICCSTYVEQYMHDSLKVDLEKVFRCVSVIAPITEIPAHIMQLSSSAQRSKKKQPPKCRIAYFSRAMKRQSESDALPFLFLSAYPEYEDKVEFIRINAMPYEKTLTTLRSSDILITNGYFDSYNLSAIEGMACGCHVLGYTGLNAPVPYFNSNNGWWFSEEGQLNKEIALVKQAVDLYYSKDPKAQALRTSILAAAAETAQLFAPESELTQIVPTYEKIWQETIGKVYGDKVIFASKVKGTFIS